MLLRAYISIIAKRRPKSVYPRIGPKGVENRTVILSEGQGGRPQTTLSPRLLSRAFMASEAVSSPEPPVEAEENPETHKKLIAKLQSADIKITQSHHVAVKTSEEAAQIRGVALESGAKAIVMSVKLKASSGEAATFALFVMSATHKLDSKKAKKLVPNCKSMSFASPEQVKALTGCIPGAVPPFGSLWSIQTYMDTSLRQVGDIINFNAGLRTDSVTMLRSDYEKVEAPVVAEFTSPPV